MFELVYIGVLYKIGGTAFADISLLLEEIGNAVDDAYVGTAFADISSILEEIGNAVDDAYVGTAFVDSGIFLSG
jgi:hypothetical protein